MEQPVRKYRKEPEWRKLYAEHQASGLSMSRFCRERGISVNSYSKWRDKFSGKTSQGQAFRKLEAESQAEVKQLELTLPAGIKLKLNL